MGGPGSGRPLIQAVCPECRQGKHINCDGVAWSEQSDTAVPCSCDHRSS